MFYRVQCVDRVTGDQSERLYHAPSPEGAAKMAMADGFVVGGVRPDTPAAARHAAEVTPQTVLAPAPTRLEAYTGGSRSFGVGAFFRFEALLFPVLVKWLFILLTAAAIVATIAAPIDWLATPDMRNREGAMRTLEALGFTWGAWIVLRLTAEFYVVVFAVHDRLREIERNTRGG